MIDFIVFVLIIVTIMGFLLSFPLLAYYLTTAENIKDHWWNVMWSIINDHTGLPPKLVVFFFILCPAGIFGFITGVYNLDSSKNYIFAAEIAGLTGLMFGNKSFLRIHRESLIAKLASSSYCFFIAITSYMYAIGSVDTDFMMKNWVLYSLVWGGLLFVALVKLKILELKNL